MTVSESLIQWLMQYDSDVNTIDTDILSATTTSYSLVKEPTINTRHYLSGRTERTEYYQLTARLDTQLNADRIANGTWLEGLERWIDEQKRQGNNPIISGYKDVFVSSSYYLGRTAEDNSLYSLTIGVKYSY